MIPNTVTTNFKAEALTDEHLRLEAPSIFASGPMSGLSERYAFVPTTEIVAGLREKHWLPVTWSSNACEPPRGSASRSTSSASAGPSRCRRSTNGMRNSSSPIRTTPVAPTSCGSASSAACAATAWSSRTTPSKPSGSATPASRPRRSFRQAIASWNTFPRLEP